jgi:hypothetical protein
MPIFIVATTVPEVDPVLKDRIIEQFPAEHYEIGRGQWLVSFGGTSKELYFKLSPETAQSDTYPLTYTVVFGVAGYWGVASMGMWEWINTRLGGMSA